MSVPGRLVDKPIQILVDAAVHRILLWCSVLRCCVGQVIAVQHDQLDQSFLSPPGPVTICLLALLGKHPWLRCLRCKRLNMRVLVVVASRVVFACGSYAFQTGLLV